MAMKPGRSSKLEAVKGLDDCGGSKSSALGGENFLMESGSMVTKGSGGEGRIKLKR